MTDLLSDCDPNNVPVGEQGKYRFKLDAPEFYYLGGLSKDENGRTRFLYATTGDDLTPRMMAIAGTKENTVFLRRACEKVAYAARIADPSAVMDWYQVAWWLDFGIMLETICLAIDQAIKRMGSRYGGCSSLRLFHRDVLNASERARRQG